MNDRMNGADVPLRVWPADCESGWVNEKARSGWWEFELVPRLTDEALVWFVIFIVHTPVCV